MPRDPEAQQPPPSSSAGQGSLLFRLFRLEDRAQIGRERGVLCEVHQQAPVLKKTIFGEVHRAGDPEHEGTRS